MRTPASLVHRSFGVVSLGAALALSCSGDTKQPSSDSGGSAGDGSGNTTSGGTSSGGAIATGGSEIGGASGSSAGGSDTGGAPTGGSSEGGSSSGGTSTGGSSSGGSSSGNAGMPATGGTAGAPTGGSGGSSGASGGKGTGGSAGMSSLGCISAQVPTSGRFTLMVDGTAREYILKVPSGYDVTRPRTYPLVLLLHGRMYSAQTVADGGAPGMTGPYYGLEAASNGNAILVAAQALSTSWTNENGRDVAYLNAMIAKFKNELCVDQTRTFAVGFSMGAIMTLTASCDSTSPYRAIAPMSASLPSNCSSSGKPLAYFGSHGTNDTTITPAQGEAVRNSFVAKNGCDTTTMPGDRAGCVNYQGCDAGAPVTWCTFTGVHEPPPYAGAAIWSFFSQF